MAIRVYVLGILLQGMGKAALSFSRQPAPPPTSGDGAKHAVVATGPEPTFLATDRDTEHRGRGPRSSHRERDRLIRERTAHINRIKGLLFGQGIRAINVKQHYKTLKTANLVTGMAGL